MTTSTNDLNLPAVYLNGEEDSSSQSPPTLASISNGENDLEIPLRRSRHKKDERLKLSLENINTIFQAPIRSESSPNKDELSSSSYLTQSDQLSPKKSPSRDHSPLRTRSPDTSPITSCFTQSDQSSPMMSPKRDHSPLRTLSPDSLQISSSGIFRSKRRVSREDLPFNINQSNAVIESDKIEIKDRDIKHIELASDTKETLLVGARTITQNEEKLTSMKKVDACSTEYIQEKKKESSENRFFSGLNPFAKKIENKTNDDYIDSQIQEYANQLKIRFVELGEVCVGPNEIHSHFKNMHSSSDTQDINRHIVRGQVGIKNQGEGNPKSILTHDITELDDPEQVILLTDKIEIILISFEEKVTRDQLNHDPVSIEEKQALRVDIKDLTGKLKDIKICKTAEDVAKILSVSLKKWNAGSPSQKNMARLLHAMRQEYDTIRVQTLTALIADQGPKCPKRLLDIKTELKQDRDKTIEFEFGENEVTVTHRINLKEKDNTKGLSVTLVATLRAALNDLENWTFNEELYVNAPKKSDIPEAKKLNRLFTNTGYTSSLVTPK